MCGIRTTVVDIPREPVTRCIHRRDLPQTSKNVTCVRGPILPLIIVVLLVSLGASWPATAKRPDVKTAFVKVPNEYRLVPNITYLRASGQDLKLNVYQRRGLTDLNPTIVHIHGGGWTNGNKESSDLTFLPYLEMGWIVVNVEYRLADVSHAPAAVEDCRCALRWIYRNAEQYNFDLDRIVATGNSAGGHLSFTTGYFPDRLPWIINIPATAAKTGQLALPPPTNSRSRPSLTGTV